ncbi:MAG: alpha/beta hydrolase [Pseudomonadota bacterium]
MDWFTLSNQYPSSSTLGTLNPELFYKYSGKHSSTNTLIVWLHGWGQEHTSFLPLLQQCEEFGDHLLLDFAGFGHTPMPLATWNTEDYADHIHPLIDHYAQSYQYLIFIGHSFGCRVSIRYAQKYTTKLSGVVILAGAGLKRKLAWQTKIKRFFIKYTLALGKKIDALFPTKFADTIRKHFGSADYKSAGALRPIFNNVVSEDLSPLAKKMVVPTLLIYGEQDNQTPPEFGQRYHQMMPASQLYILAGVDHYTILNQAKYQVAKLIEQWIKEHFNSIK